MFDANYFRTMLPRDVTAAGGRPLVEIQLVGGHSHRVRAIAEVADGCVTLETYQAKGDLAHERVPFGEADSAGNAPQSYRTVVSYESIAAVIFDPSVTRARARPGFLNE